MEFPTVRTVGGNLVLIYTTEAGGEYPIHGAYLARRSDSNAWFPVSWTAEGFKFRKTAPSDLDIPQEEIAKLNATKPEEAPTQQEIQV